MGPWLFCRCVSRTISHHFWDHMGPEVMVLFFLTSRENAAGPKGQAFEASHEEAQMSSGLPKDQVIRTWQSPYEIIGDGYCRTSFKFKFCSKSAHFFGALFQSDLAPCFKSSIYVCIDIYMYIHKYIHTNSNVYIYIYVDQYICIFSYTSVCAVLHIYTHIHTHTNTHQGPGEGVKNRVFTK